MGYVNIGKGKFIQSRTAKRYEILNQGSGVIIRKIKPEKQEIPESYVVRSGNANPTEQKPVAVVDSMAVAKAADKARNNPAAVKSAQAPVAGRTIQASPSAPAIPSVPSEPRSVGIPSSSSFAELQRNIEESNRREAARREEIRRKAAEMKLAMEAGKPKSDDVPVDQAETAKPAEPVAEEPTTAEQPAEEKVEVPVADKTEAEPEEKPVQEDPATAEQPAEEKVDAEQEKPAADGSVEEPSAEKAERRPVTDDDLVPLDKKALQALHKAVLGKNAGKDVTKNELRKRILAGLDNASEEALAEVYKAIEV